MCRYVKFGIALGLTWALAMFISGLVAWQFGYGMAMVTAFGVIYMGFGATLMGAVFGAIGGFIHAFLFGFVLAFFFHKICCCSSCGCTNCDCCKKGGSCK